MSWRRRLRYDWGVSIRRACAILEFARSTYHYKSRRHEQAGLEARIKEICQTRVRYGYRRVHVLLRREGWEVRLKKTIGFTANWACNCAARRRSEE